MVLVTDAGTIAVDGASPFALPQGVADAVWLSA